jgi:transcriptional regulator with XRE-family HTH domain
MSGGLLAPFSVGIAQNARTRGGGALGFGHHLRTLLEAAGLSRAELTRRTGVPASTLRNWEADRGFPHPRAFVGLARALGVTLERLAEGVEDTAEDEALAAELARRRLKGRRPERRGDKRRAGLTYGQ